MQARTAMMQEQNRIVVVGAGPVGLVCALALAQHGHDVIVLEAEPDLIIDQRAGSIQPSTLEVLSALGLAEEFTRHGLVAPKYHLRDRLTGSVVAEFDFALLKDEVPFPFVLQYEQYKITRDIFAKHAGKDFRVLFGRRAIAVHQDHSTAAVATEGPNGAETFRGGYVIGADGARSVVRKSQGIGFDGFTYPEKFVKIATRFDFRTVYPDLCLRTYFSDPEEWCNLFKVRGDAEDDAGIWRTVFPARPDESEAEALSPAALQRRLQRIHERPGGYEVENCAVYSVSQRVADRFVNGRILLAGDAAHVNNPVGGLGLNSGIHDAVNLTEKLTRVIRGQADERALSRYDRERRSVASNFVQETTIRNKKMLEERDPEIRRRNFEAMRRTAEDPELARRYLRRSSLYGSLSECAELQ